MAVRTQSGAAPRSSHGRPVRDSRWSGERLDVTVTSLTEQQADIAASGELSVDNAEILTAALEHHLARGTRFARLDVRGLSLIDTGGIEALRAAQARYLAHRGMLTLTGRSAVVRRLIPVRPNKETAPSVAGAQAASSIDSG